MSRDFKARYDVEWDPALDPSDTLRARVFREFKRQTITVIDMKKVKSIVTSSHPKAQESVTLGNGLKLEFDRDVVNDVSGMVQYYMAMRVLMHAWAWAGSYQTKDYDGADRTMATLSQCLGYADEALRLCSEYGSSSVSWLHRNDTMTRGKVSSLVRRGYTAGSALMEAMRQSHIEWRSPVAPPRPTPEERKRPQPAPEAVAPPPKRERLVKSDAFQTLSMVKGGKKICKPFNDGRGCPGNCNQIHGCDVKLPSGKPCLSQKHTRMEHPREWQPAPPSSDADGGSAYLAQEVDVSAARQVVWDSTVSASTVEAALTAARPVCWRGRGDLQQATWAQPPKGTFLLVELWAGVSGLALAMLATGINFYGAAAELDATARACAAESMPNLYHYTRVEDVAASHFRGLLARRKPRAVILGGGSPCQGNSALNKNRQGLLDARSLQPSELRRLIYEFRQLPEMDGVDLILFLENVASMPKEVLRTYSQWLQASPVMIDAATMGWVARKRLYWMASLMRCISADTVLPSGWECVSTSTGYPEFRFMGPKPFPTKISWEQGFTPLFNAADVVAAQGKGAMHTFTREFRHPTDRVSQATPGAAGRFEADHRRFPPTAYEERSLLWRGDLWRVPSPAERAEVMGFPPGLLRPVAGTQDQRVQIQNSLVGNGFHIPSIMLLLCLLPQLLQAKFVAPHLDDAQEVALLGRLEGTVWQPGRIDTFPGLLDASQLVPEIQSQFLAFPFPESLRSQITARLQTCRLSWLQFFTAWMRSRDNDWMCLGPTLILPRDRSKLFAGLGTQRYPGDSKRGLDHLLAPGLGKEAHIAEAGLLPSPFAPSPWPEPDIQFVVALIATWHQFLPRFLERCHQVFKSDYPVHGDFSPNTSEWWPWSAALAWWCSCGGHWQADVQ